MVGFGVWGERPNDSKDKTNLALGEEIQIVDCVWLAVDLGARLGHTAMRLIDWKLKGRR